VNDLRKKRLENLLMETISWILIKDIDNPKIGFVTLTSVIITPDFKHAVVYYSVLGSDRRLEETRAGLASANKLIQKVTASKLKLRNCPLIRFKFDETPRKAERLMTTFKEIVNEQDKQRTDGSEIQEIEESGHPHS